MIASLLVDEKRKANWRETTLGAVVKLINGRAYSQKELLSDGTPIIRIQNLKGGDKWYFSDLDLPEDKYCSYGDLLFAWSATFGPFIWEGSRSIYHYHIWKVEPTKKIDKLFAYYLLQAITASVKAESHGISMLHITKEKMEKWKILLPPVSEQERIAVIASKADRLRRTRRYTQQLSDTYLQSVFLEMFGDPISNSKEWDSIELGEIASIASGVTKGQKFKDRETAIAPYLRVANVQDGYLDLSEIKFIEALLSEIKALRLQKGDVLMTEGGDFDKLGRGAIWNDEVENCIHQNHVFRVRVDQQKILSIFFASFLMTQCAKSYFLRCSKKTTNLATINMTQLKGLPIPLPPLPLQQKFATIAKNFERLRIKQREADRQAEHLFQSILHRAFRGEL